MFASLPMFDLVELKPHTDRLWAAMAKALIDAGAENIPLALTRPDEALIVHWRKPEMLLSQTCGYPLAVGLRTTAHLVGTFAYDLPNPEDAGFYRSLLVTRSNDSRAIPGLDFAPASLQSFAGSPVSINNRDSLSGCVSFGVALAVAGVGSVGDVLVAEAHVNSLAAIQSSRVDLATIDALTFALLADVRPEATAGLTVLGRGPCIPCPPLITSQASMVEPLRAAIKSAVGTLKAESPETLRALRIQRFQPMTMADYDATIELGETAKRFLPVHVD